MRTASFEAGHMTAPDQVADLPFFPCTEAVVHTWLSDFFWPFFANYTYAEIAKAVFEVLVETGKQAQLQLVTLIPDALIDSFGEECRARGLLDVEGRFNDPLRLIDVFCNNMNHEQGVSHHQ